MYSFSLYDTVKRPWSKMATVPFMRRGKYFLRALTFLGAMVFVTRGDATTIPVLNFSFESPAGLSFTIDNWNESGDNGVFVSPGFGQLAAPTDGDQVAFNQTTNGDIWQTLGTTFQPGTDYELRVDVASRSAPGDSNMTMALYWGGDKTQTVAFRTLDVGEGVVADMFKTFLLTVSAAEVTSASAIGETIGIRFHGTSPDEPNNDFDLDNVRLVAVPEPSTYVLTGTMLALAGLTRRRSQTRGI